MAPRLAIDLSPVLVLFVAMLQLHRRHVLVVMAYSVAYYGILTPDRVISDMVITCRGPIVGTFVIIVMLVIPSGVDPGDPSRHRSGLYCGQCDCLGQLAVNANLDRSADLARTGRNCGFDS
jgi:hypothetical protein